MGLGDLLNLEVYLPNDYVRAAVLFVSAVLILRILLSVISKVVLKVSKKTKTDMDDIIVAKSSRPLTLLALFISLRIAIAELSLEESVMNNFALAIYTGVVVVIGYIVYVIIDTVLVHAWEKMAKRTKVEIDESLTHLVQGTLRFALIILAFLYILELWGVEILPLLGALGIAGLAVALALQPALSNIFSGVAMILDKSVRVGDWVVLEDKTWGIVQKIGIRSTKIRSFDNELIVVPNTKMADSMIHNVSMPEPTARAVVPFGVAYGSDIEKVKKIILKEIKKIKGVILEPEPSIKFLEMADSSLNFKAYFFVESYDKRLGATDEANTRIYNALNREGIEIPFPQRDVHLKKE